jgi:hypothetical protein
LLDPPAPVEPPEDDVVAAAPELHEAAAAINTKSASTLAAHCAWDALAPRLAFQLMCMKSLRGSDGPIVKERAFYNVAWVGCH